MEKDATPTLGPDIQIQQVEQAINYWRGQAGGGDGVTITREVSVLADCYGMMIYSVAKTVPISALAPAQREALERAWQALAQG